jgi:catechol 2,3-dioxygenase-like lactoylglutathione lyase family enzyme
MRGGTLRSRFEAGPRIQKFPGNQLANRVSNTCDMKKQSECGIAQRHGEAVVNTEHDMTLRVNDLKPMKQFYQDVLGFELLGEFPSAALLRYGDGSSEQIQMLGLLQRSLEVEPGLNTAGHIVFIMSIRDHELEAKRLQGLGLRVEAMDLGGIGRRSLCFHDPEGNEVELLCCDPVRSRR